MFCHQWRWRSAICASFSCRFLFAILSLENKMLEANSCPLWRSLSLRCLLSCRQLTWHSLSWRNSGRLDYLTTPSLSVRRWSWRTLLGRVVVGLVGCTPQRLLCWQTVCSHSPPREGFFFLPLRPHSEMLNKQFIAQCHLDGHRGQ